MVQGKHCLIDAFECWPDSLDSKLVVSAALISAAREAGLRVLHSIVEGFSPCGVTGVVLLAESHISIHTWPEQEYAAIDVYTCADRRDPVNAAISIARTLGARKMEVRIVERSGAGKGERSPGYRSAESANVSEGCEAAISFNTGIQKLKVICSPRFGKLLMLNGDLQLCTEDEFLYHEPLVHPACVAHRLPERILILGGGDGAATREALKWKCVRKVLVVEIDPQVVATANVMFPTLHQGAFADPRTEVVIGDAMQFLSTGHDGWDIVVADLTSPGNSPSTELFGRTAFSKIARVMATDGVFALQIGSLGSQNISEFVAVLSALRSTFSQVVPYQSFPVSFGEPWGFALATNAVRELRLDPQSVDDLLGKQTNGVLRMFDGIALSGLMGIPKHIRAAE